ncbi:MAG TPA: SPOR domain-containing protein [Gammaproteobacteria bacterium]|nr:SPOR domain-containing protein [Gammaproteobacteria bacterium]
MHGWLRACRPAADPGEGYGRRALCLLAVIAWAVLLPARAASSGPVLKVGAVLAPAWVGQGKDRHALSPGATLRPGERLVTGRHGGIDATLADGTRLRLGPEAELALGPPQQEPQRLLEANLKRGVLRYAAPEAVPLIRLDLSIGPLQCRLHGADALAFVTPRPGVLLLAGDVLIGPPDGRPTWRSKPDTRYMLSPGGGGLVAQTLSRARAESLSGRLDLPSGSGVREAHGRWAVNLASLRDHTRARHLAQRLDRAGIAASTRRFQVHGDRWYRVAVSGFVSRADAERFARSVRGRFRIGPPWVRKVSR